MNHDLKKGDFVIATKWDSGDPNEHWCVGYYAGITAPHYDPPRYDVTDSKGKMFRGNGFRRVEKISPKKGMSILRNAKAVKSSGLSIWDWVKGGYGEA